MSTRSVSEFVSTTKVAKSKKIPSGVQEESLIEESLIKRHVSFGHNYLGYSENSPRKLTITLMALARCSSLFTPEPDVFTTTARLARNDAFVQLIDCYL